MPRLSSDSTLGWIFRNVYDIESVSCQTRPVAQHSWEYLERNQAGRCRRWASRVKKDSTSVFGHGWVLLIKRVEHAKYRDCIASDYSGDLTDIDVRFDLGDDDVQDLVNAVGRLPVWSRTGRLLHHWPHHRSSDHEVNNRLAVLICPMSWPN